MNIWFFFFFSSRRRHTRWTGDWSSDVCSSDLTDGLKEFCEIRFGQRHAQCFGERFEVLPALGRRLIVVSAWPSPREYRLIADLDPSLVQVSVNGTKVWPCPSHDSTEQHQPGSAVLGERTQRSCIKRLHEMF